MKKRLLITSALMTAVLGASLATGTYAWYSATSGSVDLTANDSATVSAQDTYASFGNLVFSLDLEVVEGEKIDLTDALGKTYVMTTATTKQEVDAAKPVSSLCKLTVTYNSDVIDTADKLAAYAGTYTVTLATSDYVKVAKDENGAKTAPAGADLTMTVTISSAGVVSYSETDGVLEFYYALQTNNVNGVESERTDTLSASIAKNS